MKKVMLLIAIVLSLIVFTNSYQDYDNYYLHNLDKFYESFDSVLSITATEIGIDGKKFYSEVSQIMIQNNISAFFGQLDQTGYQLDYYVAGDVSGFENVWLYQGEIEKLDDNDVFSTFSHDISRKIFKPIDDMKIQFMHISNFKEVSRQFDADLYIDISKSELSLDQLVQLIRNIDENVDVHPVQFASNRFDITVDRYQDKHHFVIIKLMICSLVLALSVWIFYLKKNARKINLMFINGFSHQTILYKILNRQMIIFVGVYLLTQILLVFSYLGTNIKHSSYLIYSLLKYGLIFVFLLTVVIFILYLQICVQKKNDIVKGKEVNKFASNVLLTIQVLIVMIMLQIFMTSLIVINSTYHYYLNRKSYLNYSVDLYSIGNVRAGNMFGISEEQNKAYLDILTSEYNYMSRVMFQLNEYDGIIYWVEEAREQGNLKDYYNYSSFIYPKVMSNNKAIKLYNTLNDENHGYMIEGFESVKRKNDSLILLPSSIEELFKVRGDFSSDAPNTVMIYTEIEHFNPGYIRFSGSISELQKKLDEHVLNQGLNPVYNVESETEKLMNIESQLNNRFRDSLFEMTLIIAIFIIVQVLYINVVEDENKKRNNYLLKDGYDLSFLFLRNYQNELSLYFLLIVLLILMGYVYFAVLIVSLLLLVKFVMFMKYKNERRAKR